MTTTPHHTTPHHRTEHDHADKTTLPCATARLVRRCWSNTAKPFPLCIAVPMQPPLAPLVFPDHCWQANSATHFLPHSSDKQHTGQDSHRVTPNYIRGWHSQQETVRATIRFSRNFPPGKNRIRSHPHTFGAFTLQPPARCARPELHSGPPNAFRVCMCVRVFRSSHQSN